MHPVPQGLPIHPGLSIGVLAAAAVQYDRDCQQTPALRRILALGRKTTQRRSRVVHTSDPDRSTHLALHAGKSPHE